MAKAINKRFSIFASQERDETTTSRVLRNDNGSAVRVRLNVTVIEAEASIVPKIQGQKPDGTWEDLLTGAAITTVSSVVLTVGRGLTASANLTVNNVVPSRFRVVVTAADDKAVTYDATAEIFA